MAHHVTISSSTVRIHMDPISYTIPISSSTFRIHIWILCFFFHYLTMFYPWPPGELCDSCRGMPLRFHLGEEMQHVGWNGWQLLGGTTVKRRRPLDGHHRDIIGTKICKKRGFKMGFKMFKPSKICWWMVMNDCWLMVGDWFGAYAGYIFGIL